MTNPNSTQRTDRNRGYTRMLRNALRAVYGTPPFLVQHGLRQRYVDRHDEDVDAFSERMPSVRPSTTGSSAQTRDDGRGPIVMRTFEVRIADPDLTASDLMVAFRNRSNDFVPRHVAGFVRGDEEVRSMVPGDEFVVEIPGPWNGPVRVDAVDETSVLLVTLDGHMEAGHIRFAVVEVDGRGYRFQIRSWARAGDELFRQLHLVLGVAHEAQTAMWAHTCDRAVAISGGSRHSAISVRTERLVGSSRNGDSGHET